MSKPKLVLIGEVHPIGLEGDFEDLILKKLVGKRPRAVVDKSKNFERTKKAIKLINDEILKKEVGILRKHGIRRLFLELPDSKGYQRVFEEFRKEGNYSRLKKELRALELERSRSSVKLAIKIIERDKSCGGINPSLRIYLIAALTGYLTRAVSKEDTYVFKLYPTIFYRTGIRDVCPIEDARSSKKAASLVEIIFKLVDVMDEYEAWRSDADALGREMRRKLDMLSKEREERMAQKIRKMFIDGSAAIVGSYHLSNLKKLLATDFDIVEYEVGQDATKKLEKLRKETAS